MGSCKSFALVSPKTITQPPTHLKYLKCNNKIVDQNELMFLMLLYRELCIRNNSKKLLEKSIFLRLIKIPVTII